MSDISRAAVLLGKQQAHQVEVAELGPQRGGYPTGSSSIWRTTSNGQSRATGPAPSGAALLLLVDSRSNTQACPCSRVALPRLPTAPPAGPRVCRPRRGATRHGRHHVFVSRRPRGSRRRWRTRSRRRRFRWTPPHTQGHGVAGEDRAAHAERDAGQAAVGPGPVGQVPLERGRLLGVSREMSLSRCGPRRSRGRGASVADHLRRARPGRTGP